MSLRVFLFPKGPRYSDVVLNKLANTAKKWKVNEVVIEGNFGKQHCRNKTH